MVSRFWQASPRCRKRRGHVILCPSRCGLSLLATSFPAIPWGYLTVAVRACCDPRRERGGAIALLMHSGHASLLALAPSFHMMLGYLVGFLRAEGPSVFPCCVYRSAFSCVRALPCTIMCLFLLPCLFLLGLAHLHSAEDLCTWSCLGRSSALEFSPLYVEFSPWMPCLVQLCLELPRALVQMYRLASHC